MMKKEEDCKLKSKVLRAIHSGIHTCKDIYQNIDYSGNYSSFRVALNYYVKKGYVEKKDGYNPRYYKLTEKGVKHAFNPLIHRQNFQNYVDKKANEKAIKILEDDDKVKEIAEKLVDTPEKVIDHPGHKDENLVEENKELKSEINRLRADRNLNIRKIKEQAQKEMLGTLGYNNLNELYKAVGRINESKISRNESKRRIKLVNGWYKSYLTKQFFDKLKYYKPYFSPTTSEVKILPISYGEQVAKDGFYRELTSEEIPWLKMYLTVSKEKRTFSIISEKLGELVEIKFGNPNDNAGKQKKKIVPSKDRN